MTDVFETKKGLTLSDSLALSHPFLSKDHEFNRGFIYIEETAVCRRIEQVDLNWEWKVIEMTFANGMATVVGALTICGVTRFGTGQQLAQIDASGVEKNGEAYKGATTDALKRAARLFGIGRYLLGCPKEVKSYGKELDAWLREIKNEQAEAQKHTRGIPAVQPAPTESKPAPSTSNEPNWWLALKVHLKQKYGNDLNDIEAELARARSVLKQGVVTVNSTLEEVLAAVKEEIPF